MEKASGSDFISQCFTPAIVVSFLPFLLENQGERTLMETDSSQPRFDPLAADYETLIHRLVPYYQKQNSLMMDLIPLDRQAPFRALDLGCGPGVLSRLLLDTFPNAQVTAFDTSPVMLGTCKKKLWAYP